ncbi:tetratricopeptide repeat protein [Congregibacter variabilis]|uniref:Tetratricopeptide repeat protein n=1 Tax=Congregibacter variabilis TaxID=3081200 RepID=A0ABZ0I5Y0_9GAMM|nr:tetratricopeptide repeat protein [Congregibacter sp. IMCC43200]
MKYYRAFLTTLLLVTSVSGRADVWSESYRLESMSQYDSAASLFDSMLKQEPANEFARLRRAWLRYLAGNYNDSQSDYKAALEANPKSLDAQIGLTLPLLAQQRWREAAVVAQSALEIAPWNYYAHMRLMVAQEGLKQWQLLLRHTEDLHERYPSDATVLVYRARAQYWLGNKKSALESYRQVLQRIPGHIEATHFLATG